MTLLRFLIPLATAVLCAGPAHAQWSGTIGAGLRSFTFVESDLRGGQIVREHGLLPGLRATENFGHGQVVWISTAEIYGRAISYHGQSQLGQEVRSTTDERMVVLGTGAQFAINDTWSVEAATEHRVWQRDIRGVGSALGLQEHTSVTQVVAGITAHLVPSAATGSLAVGAQAILAAPERIRVGFSGALDEASLKTKAGAGVRLTGGFHLNALLPFFVQVQYDRMRVRRSEDFPVSRNGTPSGSVAQPAHSTEALSVIASYRF